MRIIPRVVDFISVPILFAEMEMIKTPIIERIIPETLDIVICSNPIKLAMIRTKTGIRAIISAAMVGSVSFMPYVSKRK